MTVDGSWKVTTHTPQGERDGTLELTTSGSSLSGTLTAPMLGALEIVDGVVDGDRLTWKVVGPITFDVTATVSGDTMKGDLKGPRGGSAPFDAVRVV